MASQGATSYVKRLYKFEGSDIEYILYLERRLNAIERNPLASPAILSPPSSPTVSGNEREIRRALRIIPYQFLSTQSSQPPIKHAKSDWIKEADQLVNEVPYAKDWAKRWEIHGIKKAIAAVLGYSPPPSVELHCTDPVARQEDKQAALLASATRYAGALQNFRIDACLGTLIAALQELVFVSLCQVLIHHGISETDINFVMRISISKSSEKHLKRLRSGALWVNRLINQLHWQGWRERASEVFILCEYFRFPSISFYY